MSVNLLINGKRVSVAQAQPQEPLLWVLREDLGLVGSKFGCGQGVCGACTVHVDGQAQRACLLACGNVQNQAITTIEGLSSGEQLHPMQVAFIKHDGFQCGYCTPGQICSSVGMLAEVKAGMPSHVTQDLQGAAGALSDDEIRERMSGNICRCSAYPNIVAAIRDVSGAAA